ncbi:MAG: hypothetical protein CM15mP93_03330 [Thiotrichaceae bacterium]|nr:MAG: hypothetical protein CM15mP93_03330 [Thiotrichaceae bacterium]
MLCPEILIQSIVSKLKEFGALEVTETEGVVEKQLLKFLKNLVLYIGNSAIPK